MDSELTLVIDQGTHSTRALAFDAAGHVVASAQQPIALHRISADRIEQDPHEIATSMQSVVATILADDEVRDRGVARAGMATQRSSIVAWDVKTGTALAPLLSWQDRRAAELLSQFTNQEQKVKEHTGLPLSPHYGASKLRWLLDNVPQVQRAQRFGPLASFLLFHLLQDRPLLVDHANASRTLLWHIDSRDWDPMLLALFGVPAELLPACRPIEDEYGMLKESRIPLTAVNGDQNAAVYSLGLPAPGTAIVNLGTGAFVLVPTGAVRVRHPRLLSGLASSDLFFGDYTIEGTVYGAGAAIQWAADSWQIADISAKLPDWLAQAHDPPIFLNSIGGLGSPFWQPGPAPEIIGDGEMWQKVVAVAESILFMLQINLETMASAGLNIEQIRISGGLANLDGLCQRLADLTGMAVYRAVETEAIARGAAWLAAGRSSYWPEAEKGKQFDPEPNTPLGERYLRFRVELDGRIEGK